MPIFIKQICANLSQMFSIMLLQWAIGLFIILKLHATLSCNHKYMQHVIWTLLVPEASTSLEHYLPHLMCFCSVLAASFFAVFAVFLLFFCQAIGCTCITLHNKHSGIEYTSLISRNPNNNIKRRNIKAIDHLFSESLWLETLWSCSDCWGSNRSACIGPCCRHARATALSLRSHTVIEGTGNTVTIVVFICLFYMRKATTAAITTAHHGSEKRRIAVINSPAYWLRSTIVYRSIQLP